MATSPDIQTQAALTANKLASAAVGFAIAAFLIAYLQLFLGNLTSGNALWKTNHAAIGLLAQHRSWRPSFRRIKILYPQISLQPEQLLKAAHTSKHIQQSSTFTYHRWGRISYPDISPDRPRATWSQIVQAFGITNASELVEDFLDSDTIPSGIDVPIQRARLFDLGRLALYLGCTSVDLDFENRELHARGEICGMTTDLLPTFGRAVRFEGDTTTLMHMAIGSHRLDTAMIIDFMCLGQFFLGIPVEKVKEFRIHPDIMCFCLEQNLPAGEYYAACQSVWPANSIELDHLTGSFADEAETQKRIAAMPILSWHDDDNSHDAEARKGTRLRANFLEWQSITRFTRPSVMVIVTKAAIPGAFIGYPSSLFLNDILVWSTFEVQEVLRLDGQLRQQGKGISSSSEASKSLQHMALNPDFFLYHKQQRLPFLGKKPAYSWLTTHLQEEYNGLPDNIKEAISSSRPGRQSACNVQVLIMPWTMALLKDYNPFEWAKKLQRRSQSTSKPYTSPSRLLWMQLVILDISIRLQIKRNPDKLDGAWGNATELQHLDAEKPLSNIMIAEGPEIVKAITDSQAYRNCQNTTDTSSTDAMSSTFITSTPSMLRTSSTLRTANYGSVIKDARRYIVNDVAYQYWHLHASLCASCTFYNDMDGLDASREYERLAIMLKIRALFFIAFLMVGPDSSQVYEARNSLAQVPII